MKQKSSLSQAQLTILETIENQVAQEKELLNQIQNQVRALTTKRQQLKGEIEAETQVLLSARQTESDKQQINAEKILELLNEQIDTARNKLKTLEDTGTTREIINNSLNILIKEKNQEIIVLNNRVSGLKTSVATLKVACIDTQKEIEAEKELLSGITDEKSTMEASISELELTRSDLTATNEQLSRDFDTKRAEYEQELSVLLIKQEKATEKIEKMQQESELIYKDLALRLKACDEKEKNLRIRERKVADSEFSIRNNAELLNL